MCGHGMCETELMAQTLNFTRLSFTQASLVSVCLWSMFKDKVWHCSSIYYRYMTEYYISVPWPLLSGWIDFWDQHISQKLTMTMFDGNLKDRQTKSGSHGKWKQSLDKSAQASSSVSKWTGRSTSTPPTKPHICKLSIECCSITKEACQPFSCGPVSSICLFQDHSTQLS